MSRLDWPHLIAAMLVGLLAWFGLTLPVVEYSIMDKQTWGLVPIPIALIGFVGFAWFIVETYTARQGSA